MQFRRYLFSCLFNTTIVDSFAACIEKMNTQYVGKFLYESSVEAAMLQLYLKDFVAIILQPTSELEAQVRKACVYLASHNTVCALGTPKLEFLAVQWSPMCTLHIWRWMYFTMLTKLIMSFEEPQALDDRLQTKNIHL